VLQLSAFRKQVLPSQNCFPLHFSAVAPLLIALLAVLYLCTCQAFPGPPLLLCISYHSLTVRIFKYCGRDCPELLKESCPEDCLCCLYCHCRATEYAFDVHTWTLACPHFCLSSVQSLHSRRMWRTVWGPWPHWHWSVSLLIAWRYARRLILPVRICVTTELIALCASLCILRVSFPGRTPSLKSSLPCLAFSQNNSHSSLIV
jgi:hypothetical protein